MRSLFSFLTAGLLLAAPALAADDTFQIDPVHSAAQFSVRHMMISNVRGEFNKVSGSVVYDGHDPTAARVDATIDAGSLNTREEKRDAHLKGPDFFDVASFPTITFVSKKIEKQADGKLKMTGDLTMHGVTRPVSLAVEGPSKPVKDMQGNERVGASATTTINRKDFGLTWNKILETGGVAVGDDVAVTIDVELVRKHAAASGAEKTTTANKS